ncbi:GDP-mannose 4,6-dehydratase [Candidatus Amarolinea aalborgensis]|uniref:GDP-mannose 4,6-dehydratase n=1 Tax=Candidatus Amarolinea aalborgensis TaxID=2249329 RepID=UPI003BF9FB42
MRVLITGGAGFIGSHLAEALLAAGHRVTIMDDLSTGRFENIAHLVGQPAFQFAIDSITNDMVLDRLTSECDMVFHLAAAVGVELIVRQPVHTIQTNVMGTEAVLRTAARYRARVLIASTSEVYGKGSRVPFSEEDDVLLGPTKKNRWAYAASKMVDEFLGLAYYHEKNLPVTIMRFFNTVGPRQTGRYGMVVPRLVGQTLAGQPLTVYGDGQQSRCFCDVADVVRAALALAERSDTVGEVFNVGGTEEITILNLARLILQVLTPQSPPTADDPRIRFVPYADAYAPGFEDMRRRVPDTSKLYALTGWTPAVPLAETIQRVADALRR